MGPGKRESPYNGENGILTEAQWQANTLANIWPVFTSPYWRTYVNSRVGHIGQGPGYPGIHAYWNSFAQTHPQIIAIPFEL